MSSSDSFKNRTIIGRREILGVSMGGMSLLGGSGAIAAVPNGSGPAATEVPDRNSANGDAWGDYLSVIDRARTKALASRWGHGPQNSAQAKYFISMLQAFGFNRYMGPRQAYPSFYSHLMFTPVEYNWGAPAPDFRYHWTAIDGARDYRIWGTRGNTKWLDLQLQRGWYGDVDQSHLANYDVDEFNINTDGTFEIIASAEQQQGNWIKLDPDADNICILVRDIWDDWKNNEGATIHIECIDRRLSDTVLLSEAQIGDRLKKIARQTEFSVDFFLGLTDKAFQKVGFNKFNPPDPSPQDLGGNPEAVYIHMIYDLKPHDAVIIETDLPSARYWSAQLADNFFQTTDYMFHQSSLNRAQARVDTDGKVRMVLSLEDPGVPNWLDPAGLKQGLVQWRWYETDRAPLPSTKTVALSELRDNLPSDTPKVTAKERKAAMEDRLREVSRRYGL